MNKYGDWVWFDGGTQRIKRASSPIGAAPATLFIEFRCTDHTAVAADGGATLWSFLEASGANGFRAGYTGAREAQAIAKAVGVSQSAASTTVFADNARHTIIAEFASTTSRTAYLDNGGAASNTVLNIPGTLTNTVIGAYDDGTSVFGAAHTQLGWCAAWSVVLDAFERQALHDGVDPRCVRPQALVSAAYGGREVGAAAPFTIWDARAAPAFEGGPRVDDVRLYPWLMGAAAMPVLMGRQTMLRP